MDKSQQDYQRLMVRGEEQLSGLANLRQEHERLITHGGEQLSALTTGVSLIQLVLQLTSLLGSGDQHWDHNFGGSHGESSVSLRPCLPILADVYR